MTFWQDKLQAESGPAQPLSLGEQYREWQRNKSANGASGSRIYDLAPTPEQRSAQKPSRYVENTYQGLEGYTGGPLKSKHLPRPGESDHAFIARTQATGLEHLADQLPAAEVEAVAAAYNAAVERTGKLDVTAVRRLSVQDYGSQREQLGAGRSRGFGSGRALDFNGHITADTISSSRPASMAEVGVIMRQREAEQRGQQPQHTDVSALHSTGTGFLGVNR